MKSASTNLLWYYGGTYCIERIPLLVALCILYPEVDYQAKILLLVNQHFEHVCRWHNKVLFLTQIEACDPLK